MRKIVLASSSPRRRELLERVGLRFIVAPADIEEETAKKMPARQLVKDLALAKALVVATRHPDAIIIAADTVAALGTHAWSKAKSKKEARRMLRALSGRSHQVFTGVCIVDSKSGRRVVRSVKTRVDVRALSEQEIKRYIKTGEPLEGSGGYKMQGTGGFIIDSIRGDYTNILGLPLTTVLNELKKFGVVV